MSQALPSSQTTAAGPAFGRKVMTALLMASLFAAAWMLADVLLLIFGSILFAILLSMSARPLEKLGASRSAAVGALSAATIVGLSALVYFFGTQFAQEFEKLASRLAEARQWLVAQPWAQPVEKFNAPALLPWLATWTASIGSAAFSTILVLVGAIYFAVDGHTYRNGFLKLVPDAYLASVRNALDESGQALEQWLRGQLVVMLVVGTLTGGALWLVELPSALALGLLAGVSNFIPYFGSIFAAAVALVVAIAQSWEMLLWVGAVLLAIQQIESYVLQPLVGARSVSLPPGLALYAIVAMGVLLGPLGLLFGFPLAVVADIAVRRIYVRDTLNRQVEILGEKVQESERE